MPKDEQTLAETIASLERLPDLHAGRIWLNAVKSIQARELACETIKGPSEYGSLVWESQITIGSLSDSAPRFHIYPSGTSIDELGPRDAAIKSVMALKGRVGDPGKLTTFCSDKPSMTVAALVRARADSPDGALIVNLLYRRDVSRADAIGWLKLATILIRQQENAAGKGS